MTGGSLFAICDERLPLSHNVELTRLGFSVIRLPASRAAEAISSHTDIVLFRHGNTVIGSADYFSDKSILAAKIRAAGLTLRLTDDIIGKEYPYDAVFNALVIGKYIFCRKATVSRAVLAYASEAGLTAVDTNQGYPACTTLPIGEGLALTSDRGMAAALESVGISALLVPESDSIKLPPYKNGFIGGCAGVFGNTIYFMGDFRTLPYSQMLCECLQRAGFTALSLGEPGAPLLDLGGIILTEGRGDDNGGCRQEYKSRYSEQSISYVHKEKREKGMDSKTLANYPWLGDLADYR